MKIFCATSPARFYSSDAHAEIPDDAVEITPDYRDALLIGISQGKQIEKNAVGYPVLIEPPLAAPPNSEQLCANIDTAADAARHTVAGDPLRAVEYERAASEAWAFAAANYQGEVPPMVAAWAIGERTAQQAADSILAEAAQYNAALVHLRTVRLNAKELIRAAMLEGNIEQAEDIAAETIASIQAAVAGIGNNAG
ncbi:conserved protein of unknown function [Pseudomonas marincola]|uniref:Phage tail protein n=1 Tax=Pseudomonas marincola TaxID=437900 RepID=A0A653E8V9_9PSED|nr:hypothetical protein [Pseudomonas marincola]CAE6923445.1 conserved protein of unknown function [Pseudomonas marincola]